MNLLKLMFYMFFYLHLTACIWYTVIMINAPVSYSLDEEAGRYIGIDGDILLDTAGNEMPQ